MIIAIGIISVAFYWLLLETDYLRVRFLIGALAQDYERKSWDELKPWNNSRSYYPMWVRQPSYCEPLTGWGWLENTMHIIPEYKIELNTYGVRYKMTIKESGILNQVMKANKMSKAQKLAYA